MINLKSIIRVLVVLLVVGFTAVFASCGQIIKGSNEEGVIQFDAEAIDKSNPLASMAPGNATLKFKQEKFAIEMSAMGVFNTSIIADSDAKTITQTVKFLNIDQACVERGEELKASNDDYALKIEETNETKEILGFKCFKAIVTKVNEPDSVFEVWYTKDLGMENSNMLTSYAPIKGVLLDYRIKKMGLELRFVATSYSNEKVSDKTFEISPSTKIVSKEEMAAFFDSL
ncbi:MAG: hypothetical protein KF900_05400 [Bacteroidetes bacterium]|nr:hypothetical protein [Bacteroidota bacterium]